MKEISILLIILFAAHFCLAGNFSVYEANYPGVKDYNVNIDEASLVIHPRGNFVELNLYMTVSYNFNSWFFKNYNELEFLWEFDLPENAIMHDFWVWFGDSIMSAEVLDKWTAESIFSDVSSPVRSPGLLTQSMPNRDGKVSYSLRLFPLKRNEKKRFKIQYLLPGRPTINSLRIWLPTTQLKSEKSPGVDQLKIIYKYGRNNTEPKIIGTDIFYKKLSLPDSAWVFKIPVTFDQFVEFELPSPVVDKFYFSTFEDQGEKFYHFAAFPPEVTQQAKNRKVLIVIDFNRFNTKDLDGEFILSYLKETLPQAFTQEDSINILIAYDEIFQGSDSWMSCSPSSIDQLFKASMQRYFPSFSNFQPLIIKAAEFINSHSDSAEVLFFTNTDEINLYNDQANQLADEIIARFRPGTKISFVDLDNKSNLVYIYETSYYVPRLQSFLNRISYATAGNLYFLRFNTIKSILGAFFYENISHFESVEVQLRFQNGYSYSKHLLTLNEGYYPLNFPIMEVGKFDGSFPIQVTVLGKIRMDQVIEKFTINDTDITPGDPTIVTSWYGDQIRALIRLPYSAFTVTDILKLSLEQKILTPYSGFLIYNPDGEHGFCQDCIDETVLTPVQEYEATPDTSVELSAFPNPFNIQVSIKLILPNSLNVKNYEISVFNTLGQKVKNLNLEQLVNNNSSIIHWNGQNEADQPVSSGVYFVVLKGPRIQKSCKVILMR